MAEPSPEKSRGPSEPAWYAGGILAALVVVATLITVLWNPGSEGSPEATTTTTSVPPTSAPPADDAGVQEKGPLPQDQVAYVTADGRVMSGTGATAPVEVASGAATGPTGLGAIEIAPSGDVIAFVRTDGAVVMVPVGGGEQVVLGTDASTVHLGERPSLVWDPTGQKLSYLAVGTQQMVEPRPEIRGPLSAGQGVFRVPLPEGTLGNVVKVVNREGTEVTRVGDPSTRSMVGLSGSLTEDLILVESVIPGTMAPYTVATTTSGSKDISTTALSADDPAMSPDGNYVVAVGPHGDSQELLRISTDNFAMTTLSSDDDICAPSISPDSTRIAYGAGPGCSKLMLISARGGTPVDISPPGRPGTSSFKYGRVAWTNDGHFVVYSDCRVVDGPVRCGGPVTFFDPDRRLLIPGIDATTVATVTRPVIVDMSVDLILDGPIEYKGSFPVDVNAESELGDIDENTTSIDARLADDDRSLAIKLGIDEGSQFAAGLLSIKDPASGLNRTLLVTGAPSLLGLRVGSLAGMWVSTDDLPFESGEFRLAIRRDS